MRENLSKLSCFHSDTSGVCAASRRQMFLSDVAAITISFSQVVELADQPGDCL
jgi:hypothetical protein